MKVLTQKAVQFIQKKGLTMAITLSMILTNCLAWADDPVIGNDDIGTMALKAQGEALSVKTFLWTGTQAAGIAMFFGGLLLWRKIAQEKSQKSPGQALLITFIGAACYFLPYFIGAAASSLLSA